MFWIISRIAAQKELSAICLIQDMREYASTREIKKITKIRLYEGTTKLAKLFRHNLMTKAAFKEYDVWI